MMDRLNFENYSIFYQTKNLIIKINLFQGEPFNVLFAEPKSDLGSRTQNDTSILCSLASFALSRLSNNPIAVVSRWVLLISFFTLKIIFLIFSLWWRSYLRVAFKWWTSAIKLNINWRSEKVIELWR